MKTEWISIWRLELAFGIGIKW
jgi:hypothetical protein